MSQDKKPIKCRVTKTVMKTQNREGKWTPENIETINQAKTTLKVKAGNKEKPGQITMQLPDAWSQELASAEKGEKAQHKYLLIRVPVASKAKAKVVSKPKAKAVKKPVKTSEKTSKEVAATTTRKAAKKKTTGRKKSVNMKKTEASLGEKKDSQS